MKLFHTLHAIATAFLFVCLLGIAGSLFAVWIKLSDSDNNPPKGLPAVKAVERQAVGGGKAKARLIVLRGLKPNVEFLLYDGSNFIGRADEKPVDVDIEDQEPPDRVWFSRQHALITVSNGTLAIEDLNSANGTYVNRTRVPPGQRKQLQAEDVIQIGTVQMKVLLPEGHP